MTIMGIFISSIIMIYLCFSNISCFSYISNLNAAVISNIGAKIGNHDSLTAEELKAFLDNITQVNPNEIDHGNSTWDPRILRDCSSEGSLSACREVLTETCLDGHVLSEIYATPDSNVSLKDVFPALVYQGQSSVCKKKHHEAVHRTSRSNLPTGAVWAYGFGVVALICVISNVGGCMIPFMKRRVYQRILMFCVSLAVSTLVSTGCLILLPESLELTGKDSPIPDYHFKMAVALAGVYLFYLSDSVQKAWNSLKKAKSKTENDTEKQEIVQNENIQMISTGELQDGIDTNNTNEQTQSITKSVATVAWMVLMGDSLHKFVDGLSIGAAFTENIFTGLSVSLAILCEELPKELGDIAILLHAGMSIKRALLYNLLAALTCFAGLACGIILGETIDASLWIFAIAGGMFFYVALVDMVPEMNEQAKYVIENGIETPATTLALQNLGLILGFGIMFILAIFGGEIML